MAIKDFMHALFKEEVEEETEELAVREPEHQEQEPPTTVVTETEYEESKAAQPERQPEPQPYIAPEPVMEIVRETPQSSIFAGLDVSEIEKAPAGSRQSGSSRPAYKFDRSKLSKATVTDDYQAVISPIFGNIEDEDKEYEKVHNAVELPRPEEGFSMTTVISPMFGNDLPEPKPVERIPDYRKKEIRKPAPVSDLLDTAKPAGYESDPLLPEVQEDGEK